MPELLVALALAGFLKLALRQRPHTRQRAAGLVVATLPGRRMTVRLVVRLERPQALRNLRAAHWVPRAQPGLLAAQETRLRHGAAALVVVVVAMVHPETVAQVELVGAVPVVVVVVPVPIAAILVLVVRVEMGSSESGASRDRGHPINR